MTQSRMGTVLCRTITFALILALIGCSKPASETAANPDLGPGTVATVNGKPIPESLYRRYAQVATQRSLDELSQDDRDAVLDRLIDMQLLTAQAIADGLPKERTIAADLELTRIQTIANAAARRYIDDNPPTEDEIRAQYDETADDLTTKEYKARHILLDTREEAEEVINLLNSGDDFSELAKSRSTDPTGSEGGDLGWINGNNSAVEPFMSALADLEPGSYSQTPIQTQYGWHVVFLEDSRTMPPPDLSTLRDQITTTVQRKKFEDYLSSLRSGAEISIE